MQHGARVSRGFIALHSGLVCLVTVLVFVAVSLTMQWVRSDLDWRLAPMSSYLKGPYGAWLRLAYYGLGVGLVLLGQGLDHVLRPPIATTLPRRLLAVAGIALVFTAVTETNLPHLDRSQEVVLHQLAAAVTFFCVSLAMLLQSWRFQGHDAWRPYFRLAFPLAVVSFVSLAVYACGRGMPASLEFPEGSVQKTVIAMILLWLGLAAWWLRTAQLALAPVRIVADDRRGS